MDTNESFEAVIAADAAAQAVSGTNEQITEAPAQTLVEKVEETVEAAVQAVETEAVQVEQTVVAEVEKVVELFQYDVLESVKEGFVAGEHFVREKIDVVVGTSRIRNPA